ncbi:MAG: ABC transporter permease [Acidobacteria bacterium]|nr:ABC transporter permease [Acidobacteriota bacterium]
MAGSSMLGVSIFREGIRTLLRNKLRSSLTVLGISVGIGAVICVVAIGDAGSEQIQQQLANLGDNLVWIEAGGRQINGARTGAANTKSLIYADQQAMLQQIPYLKACSPQVDSRVQIVFENQNWNTTYRGVSPEYLDIRRWQVDAGTTFTQEAVDTSASVVLLGRTVANFLFPNDDPIGKTIRIKNVPFRVIGTLAPKGMSSMGSDQDDGIMLPWTTAQKRLAGKTWLDDIMCTAVSGTVIKEAGEQAAGLLRERHHIFPGQDDDFNIRNPEDAINLRLEASKTFTMFLVSVGSVSLLVGGIGIMNVMLVSVTERTREIGVRMAVGATENNVQMQFLGESVMLSLTGGAAGVLVGVLATQAIGQSLGWPMLISPEAILIAGLFSFGVGVFFGYYPARKAASLDPIEALRYE